MAAPKMLSVRAGSAQQRNVSRPNRITVKLDTMGTRGLVLFDHQEHEAEINPDPNFVHKSPVGIACVGCHHTVTDLTDIKQFQKCSVCHKDEGDPTNHVDKNNVELNRREIYHRLCISCHRADNIRVSNERITNASFTKCGECHDKNGKFVPVTEAMQQQPAPPILPPVEEETPGQENVTNPYDKPLGYASRPRRVHPEAPGSPEYVPRPDRWRIGFPQDPRYQMGRLLNPYNQNLLKGDYPLFGQHNFLVVTAESESFVNGRRVPVPSDVSAQNPNSEEFFGRGGQIAFDQLFSVSLELFHGDTSFKPVDWRIHVTPVFDLNYLDTQENGIVNINVARGSTRLDSFIALQDAFVEVRLGDTPKLLPFLRHAGSQDGKSPYFDTTSVRAGIQPFVSDFRGFVFSDTNLGARLFGNYASNRYQYNAAYFNMLEKDTNSGLNTRNFRNQSVFIANIFRQDTFLPGYTSQFSFLYNDDRASIHFDENGFLVRPAEVGDIAPHGIKVGYFGWNGDGHLGPLNITHSFYEVVGHDTHNPIAGRRVDVNAQMAAVELSKDRDWFRIRGSFFWASGDKNPSGSTAHGFDSIVDLPDFAGGQFSFWNSQEIRLTQTGVALTSENSLLPSLRSSKFEGQANFVNPGIFIYNAGADAEITQKLKAVFNLNYLRFQYTEPLEFLLFQPGIRNSIGFDYGGGIIYRPKLSDNIILTAGVSSLVPGSGFKDIYTSACSGEGCGAKPKDLFSLFLRLKFTY